MIPMIGLMIGMYVLTRMFEILLGVREHQPHTVVVILAILTIVIAVFGMGSLLITGSSIPTL